MYRLNTACLLTLRKQGAFRNARPCCKAVAGPAFETLLILPGDARGKARNFIEPTRSLLIHSYSFSFMYFLVFYLNVDSLWFMLIYVCIHPNAHANGLLCWEMSTDSTNCIQLPWSSIEYPEVSQFALTPSFIRDGWHSWNHNTKADPDLKILRGHGGRVGSRVSRGSRWSPILTQWLHTLLPEKEKTYFLNSTSRPLDMTRRFECRRWLYQAGWDLWELQSLSECLMNMMNTWGSISLAAIALSFKKGNSANRRSGSVKSGSVKRHNLGQVRGIYNKLGIKCSLAAVGITWATWP